MKIIYILVVAALGAKGFVVPVAQSSEPATPALEADLSPVRRSKIPAQDGVQAVHTLNDLAAAIPNPSFLGGRVIEPRFQHHKHPWPTDYDVLENEGEADPVPVDLTATTMDQVIDIKQSIEEIVQAAVNLTNGTILLVAANLTNGSQPTALPGS